MLIDIQKLRQDVNAGHRQLRITSHAQTEAFKDGLLLADLRFVFDYGEIIESYPDDNRILLYTDLETNIPVHIVIEEIPQEAVIITAYIPDKRLWIKNKRRRQR